MKNAKKWDRIVLSSIVILIWALIYLPGLGWPEIHDDEHKRVFPAMAMIRTGNWLVPELAGEDYFKKPPLINWMIASSFLATGRTDEFAARLPSVLMILAFVLCLLLVESEFMSFDGRIIASLVFLTTIALMHKGRTAEIDGGYTALAGAASYLWICGYCSNNRKTMLWLSAFFVLGLGLLLKGPMILLFFYSLFISVLYFMGDMRKAYSKEHVLGLVIMLLMFCSWAYFSAGETGQTGNMAGTWHHELLLRFRDNLSVRKWAGRVLSAIFNFMPWLVFVPLMFMGRALAGEPRAKLFKACRFALLFSFFAVCMMPGTRARYSMPAFGLGSILVGWIISVQSQTEMLEKIWKICLKVILAAAMPAACLITLAWSLLAFIDPPRFIAKSLAGIGASTIVPGVAVAVATLVCAIFLYRLTMKISGPTRLSVLSAIIVTLISLNYVFSALPVLDNHAVHRPAGKLLSSLVPENMKIYTFKVGSEHLFFYVDRPVSFLRKIRELPDDAEYFMVDSDKYGDISEAPFITDRRPVMLGDVKADKRTYHIIRFGEKYAGM